MFSPAFIENTSSPFVGENNAISQFGRVNCPHFVIPSLNCIINSVEKNKFALNYVNEYVPVPYTCSLPVPLGIPAILSERSINVTDPMTKLVNDKHIWEIGKDELIASNLKLKKHSIINTKHKNIKKISREVVRLAEHLDQDPDPNFSGFYNWYYSDGCLNNISINNMYSIIYAHGSLLGTCVVTPVDIDNSECVLLKDRSSFLRTGRKQHIFQISVKDNFVLVRQKNFTSVFTVTNDRKFKFKKIHKHSEIKDSIVSVSINDDLDCTYCSLTSSYKLKLWSPEIKNECINCVELKKNKPCDRWGSVKYISNNNILVSTRSRVFLKDTRIQLEQNAQKWKINFNGIPCEFISLIMKSNLHDCCAYIGTTHYCYELDFRKGLSKQWMHMMELPPMYGAVSPLLDGSETLFIASQNFDEICTMNSNLQVMPYILPSPSETRCKANLQGLCLDPLVSSRFNCGMIGMTVVPNNSRDNSAFVFRSNSAGDIFYQSVVDKDEPNNFAQDYGINLESLAMWEKNCVKSVDTMKGIPLKVTNVVNFNELYNIFNGNDPKALNFTCTNHKLQASKIHYACSWKNLKPKFLEAHDPFTQSLVDVWNITSDKQTAVNYRKGTFTKEIVQKETQDLADRTIHHKQTNDEDDAENVFNVLGLVDDVPNQSSLSLEDSSIPFQSIRPADKHTESINNNLLHYEECNEINREECNFATPKKVIQKKTVKPGTSGIKGKSRFSSGF